MNSKDLKILDDQLMQLRKDKKQVRLFVEASDCAETLTSVLPALEGGIEALVILRKRFVEKENS